MAYSGSTMRQCVGAVGRGAGADCATATAAITGTSGNDNITGTPNNAVIFALGEDGTGVESHQSNPNGFVRSFQLGFRTLYF